MRSGSGAPVIDEIAAFYVYEYTTRMRLKKLGFTDSIENIDCITAEAFNIISIEIDKIHDEESKRRNKR
jgi:hypothetical protein